MTAPEPVTDFWVEPAPDVWVEPAPDVWAGPADGRYGWRLCSGMSGPEPLPEPGPELEAGR